MTDTATQQPLEVSIDGTVGPYITVPLAQVEQITRLLDGHHIRYWVEENSISMNGGPYISTINLGREGDAKVVQAILDDAREESTLMALAADIQTLRDRVLADLTAAHDYYADTKIAWDIVRKFIASGQTFSIQNKITGTTTTQADLAGKARGYVVEQLTEATFQQFIAIFENFFFDLLRLWLTAYPQSLGSKKLDFQTVLDSPDKDAITLLIVKKEVNEIAYDRPAGWFQYLNDKAKLGCPSPDEIDKIAEAKASRDVLVHNRGAANKTYESKAGKLARYKDGERIDIPEHYHRQTWELIRKVVTDTANAAMTKAP